MTIQEVIAKLQADKQNRVPSRFHCRAIMVRTIDQYCRLLEELKSSVTSALFLLILFLGADDAQL